MPKEITHIEFSAETVSELEKRGETSLSSLLKENDSSMHFGSIAVDTFYYNLKFPFEKNYFQWGDIVHGAEGEDTSLPILEMIEKTLGEFTAEAAKKKIAFLSGFLTHMAMDIVFHPFVYYFSGNYFASDPEDRINAQMRHRIIESWIDLLVLNKKSQSLQNYPHLKTIASQREINLELLDFLGKACNKAWQKDENLFPALKKGYEIQMFLAVNVLKNSSLLSFTRTLNDFMENKLRAYLALFYPQNSKEIPESIEYFGSFKHPVTGELFSGNLHDLFAKALTLSTDFLLAVSKYIFEDRDKNLLKSVIKGYSLDVGIEGVKVHEVNYFSPLKISP